MTSLTRNVLLGTAGTAALGAFYAFWLEPRWLHRTEHDLHFRTLPRALEGLRIALLSDLHGGRNTPRRLVRQVVRRTLQEAPDLIAVTGDLADNPRALEPVLDCLAELRAPLGVYIVPGNHDYSDIGIDLWHEAVDRRTSLTNLTNDAHVVAVAHEDGAARLCVAGVDDLSEGLPRLDALPPLDERDFTILLAHEPDQAEHLRRVNDDVDLVLSGHTHGGQVRLPGVGALINSAGSPELYEAGVRRRPWTQVYTSRGIGNSHLPVRFMTRPELAILTLTSAQRPARRYPGAAPRGGTDAAGRHRPVS